MQHQPRLIIPALGVVYRTVAPVTEPLIRVVAGGSLAMHGYPILFGNIGGAAKFLESAGFENGLFWATSLAWWSSLAVCFWRSVC